MTSRDFCFWLQGYLEIATAKLPTPNPKDISLSASQVDMIRRHLALVFKHGIDPSMGDPKQQAKLDAIHAGQTKPPGNIIMRC